MLKKTSTALKTCIVFFIDFSSHFRQKSMKNRTKNTKNILAHKNRQQIAFGTPFFGEKSFFWAFFGPPGSPGVSWDVPGASQNRSFVLFFRLFCSPVASEVLLGSLGTVSGRFFIDFRLIFGTILI